MAQSKSKSGGARKVESLATSRVSDNLNKLIVLGTFGTTSRPGALLRLSTGRVKKVSIGDRVAGGKILGISDGAVVLWKSGANKTLRAPQG